MSSERLLENQNHRFVTDTVTLSSVQYILSRETNFNDIEGKKNIQKKILYFSESVINFYSMIFLLSNFITTKFIFIFRLYLHSYMYIYIALTIHQTYYV